jgi:predicted O-methyltransferase YrrM
MQLVKQIRHVRSELRAKLLLGTAVVRLELGSRSARSVGRALLETQAGVLAPVERAAIGSVEVVRRQLEASDEDVVQDDYGAGAQGGNAKGGRVVRRLGELCRSASKPQQWATALFKIVRTLRPRVALELGTCLGISAAYQASALRLNGSGKLITLEGSPAVAEIARRTLAGLALENSEVVVGRFADSLPDVLTKLSGEIDYVFVDGHHDERATLDYFEQIRPHLAAGAIVIFDDIEWSMGMRRAWATVSAHPALSEAVSTGPMGICFT